MRDLADGELDHRGILAQGLGREATEAEVRSIAGLKETLFRDDGKGRLAPRPGVVHWLGRFGQAGFPQAVASSAPQENIDAIIGELDLGSSFQALVSGSSLPGKPAPDTFLLAARRLGMEPKDCLVIEDAQVGVAAAKAAGMTCLAVCMTHRADELTAADLVVNRLSDLTPEAVAGLFA